MKKFSQRMGHGKPKNKIQKETMDKDLRNGIWNSIYVYYLDPLNKLSREEYSFKKCEELAYSIWSDYFKFQIDEFPESNYERDLGRYVQIVKEYFFSCQWYEIYNFVEFIAGEKSAEKMSKEFQTYINPTFRSNNFIYCIYSFV